MQLSRRGFLGVLTGAIAAPAVCRAELLMPLRGIVVPPVEAGWIDAEEVRAFVGGELVYDRGIIIRRAFVPRLFVTAWRKPPFDLLANTEFFGTR